MARIEFQKKRLDIDLNIVMKTKGQVVGYWKCNKLQIIKYCLAILSQYKSALTLRQLYYQLVARDLIPNHDAVYKRFGNIIRDARLAGVVDWSAIEDRIRVAEIASDWGTPQDALNSLGRIYRTDRMRNQPNWCEVWCEKDAISSLLSPITRKYGIPLMINRGYSGWSAFYESYRRIFNEMRKGRKVTILYLGDHDPSGLDMVRDIYDRLFLLLSNREIFLGDDKFYYMLIDEDTYQNTELAESLFDGYRDREDFYYKDEEDIYRFDYAKAFVTDRFAVKHIGITMSHIQQFNAPPNPAKVTDKRAKKYMEEHGESSWELDAIPPNELTVIVEDAVKDHVDLEIWNEDVKEENENRARLLSLISNLSDEDE